MLRAPLRSSPATRGARLELRDGEEQVRREESPCGGGFAGVEGGKQQDPIRPDTAPDT